MTNFSQRTPMVPITSRVRAYFSPVDRNTNTVTIFDPARYGWFDLDAPPAPWLDMGWVENFQRSSGTTIEAPSAGSPAVVSVQHRVSIAAHLEFDFREWGKLQMALAGGSQHLNVLAVDPSADPQPSGGTPLSPVAVLPGSTADEIVFGAGSVETFSPGDILAIDVDYRQQSGYVGTGVAAAYIRDPADVRRDVNYIRRVTFNVGRVAQRTSTSVLLTQALVGGAPAAGSSAQKVAAFVDREGGSYFQQWSALFVLQEESGGRICFYYPRLTADTPRASQNSGWERETRVEVTQSIGAVGLHASFAALPYTDVNDGEVVLCYRVYFPASAAAMY